MYFAEAWIKHSSLEEDHTDTPNGKDEAEIGSGTVNINTAQGADRVRFNVTLNHPGDKVLIGTKIKNESTIRVKLNDFLVTKSVDIPDILFEAIIEEQKKYEKNKRRRINCKTTPFIDDNYICCSTLGHSRSKGFHQKYYAKLLEENNLPKIRFHDLRHTYGTILLKANFDAKAVSKILGHSSEIITVDVYCDTEEIIYDCLETLEPFISEIAPISNEGINNLSLDEELDYAYNNIENIVYNI